MKPRHRVLSDAFENSLKCFEMPVVGSKRFETPIVGSRSDASDAFFCDLISTVITLVIKSGDYIASDEPDLATYPSSLK